MTRVWVALGLLSVILTLAFSEYNLTMSTVDDISKILEKTEISAKNRSDETEQLCGEIADLWEKKKVYLAMFLSHEELDAINITLDRIEKFCENKDFEKLYVECGTLQCQIVSLKETEMVNLHNIL